MSKFNFFDNQRKSEDYQFMDGVISEWFERSCPSIFVHKYLGVAGGGDEDEDGNAVPSTSASATSAVVPQIQDVVLMENRDRKYDRNVKEMFGFFQIPDTELSLSQFGIFLSSDTLFLEVHLNDMLAMIGRKIIAGDVIELPNFRDDALINQPNKASNKFYVVVEGKRAPSGYQATWLPHIWRLKLEPMKASQEYQDILNAPTQNPFGIDDGGTIGALISTAAASLGINQQIVQQAQDSFLRRNFETRHLYMVPGDATQDPWIYAGDGVPPNGAELVGAGGDYPELPNVGDYFLRTDYRPNQLFMYKGDGWYAQEMNYRQIWTAASRLMMEHLNNRNIITFDDGTTQPSKQNLYQVNIPKADFGADNLLPGDTEDFPMLPKP